MTNQNMIIFFIHLYLSLFVLVQEQEIRNLLLILNEMRPGQTSLAWHFHSPGYGRGSKYMPTFAYKKDGTAHLVKVCSAPESISIALLLCFSKIHNSVIL